MNREFHIRKKLDFLPTTKELMGQRWRTSLLGFIGALVAPVIPNSSETCAVLLNWNTPPPDGSIYVVVLNYSIYWSKIINGTPEISIRSIYVTQDKSLSHSHLRLCSGRIFEFLLNLKITKRKHYNRKTDRLYHTLWNIF